MGVVDNTQLKDAPDVSYPIAALEGKVAGASVVTSGPIRVVGGARDGEFVHETSDWAHPNIRALSAPIQLRAGEGLKAEITWSNTTSRIVRFSLTSEDEMGIIFGYAH